MKVILQHGGWDLTGHLLIELTSKKKKGIIITMDDEPLNPYLPADKLNCAVNGKAQADINTKALYEEASQKFDIFHIAIDGRDNCCQDYKDRIHSSFGALLGQRLVVSTINDLVKTITECIDNALGEETSSTNMINENGEISL